MMMPELLSIIKYVCTYALRDSKPVSVQQAHLLEKYHVVPLHMVRYNRHVEEG